MQLRTTEFKLLKRHDKKKTEKFINGISRFNKPNAASRNAQTLIFRICIEINRTKFTEIMV